jgi:hypothetical protein
VAWVSGLRSRLCRFKWTFIAVGARSFLYLGIDDNIGHQFVA